MATMPGYTIHGLERMREITALVLFFPLVLSVLSCPAWMLFVASGAGEGTDSRVPLVTSSYGVLSWFLILYGSELGGHLVAENYGFSKERTLELRWLNLLPLLLLVISSVPIVLMVAESQWSMMAFGVLLFCALFVLFRVSRRDCRRAIRNYNIQINDLVRTLAPRWPVGSPGSDVPIQLPPVSSYARRVLVVRTSDAVAVLRLIQDHTPVETLCFLPRLPFRAILIGIFPWLEKAFPTRSRSLVEAPPEKLADLVADWGGRSHLRWHGVLDDGTQVVRNEGEVRIVPLGGEQFEEYRGLLAAYGTEIGIQQFYVQAGCEVSVETCKSFESHSFIRCG